LGRSLALHLLPGALATLIYVVLVPLVTRAGFPPLFALLIATLVGFVPIELGHLFLKGKSLTGRWSLQGVLLYHQRGTWRRYALLVPAIVVLSVGAYILAAPLDRIWSHALFSWLPSWYTYSDLSSYSQFSRVALLITFSLRLLIDGIIAPVTEELYFRGYLLPRISRLGWGAPFLNCLLFSIYHFWQPYNLPSIFFLSLPMVIGAWKTRDVRVSVVVHMVLNLTGAIVAMHTVLRMH
jgi:membrane protease YdiL (CAAX protease family)